MAKEVGISSVKKGMNRTSHPTQMGENEYSFLLNGINESETGDRLNIRAEKSNVLTTKIKDGYKVVQTAFHLNRNRTYVFLTNPTTNISEIGYIDNHNQYLEQTDTATVITPCKDCDKTLVEQEQLQNQNQQEYNLYTTILEDSCNNCLGFNIQTPINNIFIKDENIGAVLYWTDPIPRNLELDNLEQYLYEGQEICDSSPVPTCLDCEKLKLFPDNDIFKSKSYFKTLGGRLKRGSYEVFAAYCDLLGNELTNYYSVTPIIPLFDESNVVHEIEENDNETNFSLQINLKSLDSRYKYYKTAVRYYNSKNIGTNYDLGTSSTEDTSITISTLKNSTSINSSRITRRYRNVEMADAMAVANNMLFLKGIKDKPVYNLQKAFNLLGGSLKWQSFLAKGDLYKKSNSYKYLSYNRNENVPVSISLVLKDGRETNTFYIQPPYLKEDDPNNIVVNENTVIEGSSTVNQDIASILGRQVDSSNRNRYYQFYNTATYEGNCVNPLDTSERVTQPYNTYTSVEIPNIPAGNLKISLQEQEIFTNLADYINDNIDNLNVFEPTPSGAYTDIRPYIDILEPSVANVNNPAQANNPEIPLEYDVATNTGCQPYGNALTQEVFAVGVLNESISVIYKSKFDEYTSIRIPSQVDIYERAGDVSEIDYEHSYAYNIIGSGRTGAELVPLSRRRVQRNYNYNCIDSEVIQNITPEILNNDTIGVHFLDAGGLTLADLQESKTIPFPAAQNNISNLDNLNFKSIGHFSDKLHKSALWYKTSINQRDEFFINLSELKRSTTELQTIEGSTIRYGTFNKGGLVRVSIFTSCSSNTAIYSEIFDLSDNHFITVDSTILTNFSNLQSDLYIAIDAPIVKSYGYGPDWQDYIDVTSAADPDFQGPGDGGDESNRAFEVETFTLLPPDGSFSVAERDKEAKEVNVSFDEVSLRKTQQFETTCVYPVPNIEGETPVSYQYGKLGYYQSTENIPDNSDLYNSSELLIDLNTLTSTALIDSLNEHYIDPITNSLDPRTTDLRCKPITLYKIPGNEVSPIIYDLPISRDANTLISPIGFRIDPEAIRDILKIAVVNNLITQKQFDDVVSYKVYRGDIELDRSVIASGIGFQTKQYTKDNVDIRYINYPYNMLGEDRFFKGNQEPNGTDNFDMLQVLSPELDYNRVTLPSEVIFEGYQKGNSTNSIQPVKDHLQMVVLGRKAERLAGTLALLEIVFEGVVQSMQAFSNYNQQAGFTNTVFAGAFVATPTLAAIHAVSGAVFKYGQYRYQWLETFRNIGEPTNFGYYNSSYANYNTYEANNILGQKLRPISKGAYLPSSVINLVDDVTGKQIRINNTDREEAALIYLGDTPIEELPVSYVNYDNSQVSQRQSSQVLGSDTNCQDSKEPTDIRNVISPYVHLVNYIANQYGDLHSIRWIDTKYCYPIDSSGPICDFPILGGDTFISKHTRKRKANLFFNNGHNLAPKTPFQYSNEGMYGEPNYYIDYESTSEFSISGSIFPKLNYEVRTDCGNRNTDFYLKKPSKFYLYSYGFPSFYTETRINTNFRNAQKEIENQFYPQNQDIVSITQQSNVPIRQPENFFINTAFSTTKGLFTNRLLNFDFSEEDRDKLEYNTNSVMHSLADNNENSRVDPWRTFLPLNSANLPATKGKLVNLLGIESDQLLVMYEKETDVVNPINDFVDGRTEYNSELISGAFFSKRALSLRSTSLGYGGTSSTQTISTEFGDFWLDAPRGQVFQYLGGQNLVEISKTNGKEPTNMDSWFREHLPFKIVKDIPNYDQLDNHFNGVGIHWAWDSRYRRVILTKKDYIVVKNNQVSYIDGSLVHNENTTTIEELLNNGIIKDVSWTLTYKPEYGKWESYMSYTPDYYINLPNYFQSGINKEGDEKGLWSHGVSNKSFRVFYGKKYNKIVELPISNKILVKRIESITIKNNTKRYHNDYDFAAVDRQTYDKAWVFNEYEHSGELELTQNIGGYRQLSKYPITKSNSQEILVSNENQENSFNYFYNRVISNRNNQPIRIWDENQIQSSINNNAVKFKGKKILERLKGSTFTIRLEETGNTNYTHELLWVNYTLADD